MALRGEQVGDAHRSRYADPGEVIADEIGDHEVLRPLFRVGHKGSQRLVICRGIHPAWRSAFHRAALDRVSCNAQEQFGRNRQDPLVAHRHNCAMRRRLPAAQGGVEAEGHAPVPEADRESQVGLVDVASVDQLQDALHLGHMDLTVMSGVDLGQRLRRQAGKHCIHDLGGQKARSLKQTHPDERVRPDGRQLRAQTWLQHVTEFVGEETRSVQAAVQAGFEPRERGLDLVRVVTADDVDRPSIEPRRR
jgi:hypothetical protein